ncbi:MAG: hypothetical protein RRY64_06595 [Oscillospiraceae bacterium]
MGGEEVENGGAKMSSQKKPRICEILGVEVDEDFEVEGLPCKKFHANEKWGVIDNVGYMGIITLIDIINHPEKIIREPKFADDDIELMRHIRAVFGLGALYRTEDGKLWFTDGNYTSELPKNILNCIEPGDEPVRMKQVL